MNIGEFAMKNVYEWPYANEFGVRETVESDLVVLGGGIMHDWDLKTNIDGIYAAGDQLFASDCCGFACATGYYAGRKAADWAANAALIEPDPAQIDREEARLYAPMQVEDGMDWRELNMAISKCMQNYCGAVKCEELLREGLDLLEKYEREDVPTLSCANPYELMHTHEVLDILTVPS